VTNIFLLEYETRLKAWSELRSKLQNQPLEKIIIEVDKFWQKTPIQTYYLHTDLINEWPNPWQLISDNIYCIYSRALGMMYTLMLLGIQDIDFVEGLDHNNNEVVLVLVDSAKYVMNYWPDTVLNNSLQDFVVKKKIDITPLKSKLG